MPPQIFWPRTAPATVTACKALRSTVRTMNRFGAFRSETTASASKTLPRRFSYNSNKSYPIIIIFINTVMFKLDNQQVVFSTMPD